MSRHSLITRTELSKNDLIRLLHTVGYGSFRRSDRVYILLPDGTEIDLDGSLRLTISGKAYDVKRS